MFTTIFYQPVLNLLVFIYNIIPFNDFGVAIILLTVIIKLIFWPLGGKAIKSQKALQDLQPKIDKIKQEYKDDKVASSQKIMELYKDNKINPFSSCLPLLIQLPFLWAVFRIFRSGVENNLDLVYPFISRPESINTISFGIVDLGVPNVYLAILAGLAQFWQAKMVSVRKPEIKTPGAKDENMMAIMNKQMLFIMPAVTVFIGMSLPGGLTLYWLVITLVTVIQQLLVFKKKNNTEVIEGEIVK
ncbi:MAG: YidC/Oxa1 family membrane protein insertase [Patescibacteria group bacterium]|nr:YidC/Oxa1 family membrane protein insertase [Patescibacteria group bacterium]MDD3777771.1 YidC/Oxa1 family membrane protein insertase [Patescibacteria group bacterium]MDD3939459.1 YidC/Oxa1 family membrane protein insertase [Patescibacteria group bacterium]MDD4443518.1 YidC/Oxa1 family membrane protein insertase [Patescibacteria group bacterium]